MGRCHRVSVVGLLCLVLLTSIGTKADEQTANDNVCTFYRVMDYIHDNVLTYVDLVCDFLRLPLIPSNGGLVRDVRRQLDMLGLFLTAFPLTEKNPIETITQGGVTLEEFLQCVIERRFTPKFQAEVEDLCRLIMKLHNYDGNVTTLTRREWQFFMDIFTVTLEEATTAFNNLDRDEDGLISLSEYYTAGRDYFINGTDPKSAWFCGPPTSCEAVRKGAVPSRDPIALGLLRLPSTEALSSLRLLDLLLRFVPQFDFLRSLFGPLGILPDLLRGLLVK